MDKKLQLIRHLYGETDDRDELRDLLEDEDLNREYRELSEAKFWLDHTTKERPERTVLDAIFAEAARESGQSSGPAPAAFRPDRAPLARQYKNRRRMVGSVTTLLALVITVGIGYQFWGTQDQPSLQAFSQKSAAEPMAESRASEEAFSGFADLSEKEDAAVPAAPALADFSGEADALRAATFNVADTSLPEWNDDLDDILRFQRRIDMLLEQNQDLVWDEAAVPLEMLPAGRPQNPSLLQAGSRRQNSGNQ